MSATTQPLAGQHKSAAPFGAVALIAGVLAFGAIGIALMQGSKATAVAGAVPADVQSALLVQRMGEKASLFPAGDARLIQHQGELADRLGAYATSDPRLVQHLGELQDRAAASVAGSNVRALPDGRMVDIHSSMTGGIYVTSDGRVIGRPRAIPVKPSVTVLPNGRIVPLYPSSNLGGPKTAAQKGLVPAAAGVWYTDHVQDLMGAAAFTPATTYAGKVQDALGSSTFTPATTYAGKVQDSIGAASVTRFPGKTLDDAVIAAPAARATGGLGYNHR